MKGSTKMMLSCMAAMVLCFCFSQNVNASEGISYLYWLDNGDTEAKWYIGDPVMGPEQEVSIAEMTESDSNAYYITTTPTLEVVTYLNGLEKAGSLTISNVDSDCPALTFGTNTNPAPFKGISIQDDDIEVTVYSEGLSSLFWQGGSCTVYGDVTYIELGTRNSWYANEYKPDVMVYGNVDSLDWYRGSDSNYNSFRGTFTVSGTLEEAKVYEYVEVEELGSVNLHTNNFQNVTGTIINSGVLADNIVCTETEYVNSDYTCRYTCYGWSGWSGNYWELYVFSNENVYVGSKYLANFDIADLPNDAYVLVNGSCENESLVIPKSIQKLEISNGGNVVVQGNVEELKINWDYDDASLSSSNIEVTIAGDVTNANIYIKEDAPVNITVNGNVANGLYNSYNYFSDGGLIMENGCLKVPVYNTLESAQNKDEVAYIKPSTEDLNLAANVKDTDIILGEDGAILATKKITLTVSENTDMDVALKESFETQYDVDILGVLDVNLYAGYYTASGCLYVDSTHDREAMTVLETEIPLIFTIPANAQDSSAVFGVVREHEGIYDVLKDTDSDPTTVTVMTDKFSVYMLVKGDALPEINLESEASSVVGFVTRMYQQCLSRDPDQEGLDGWVGQLKGGHMNGAQIAEQFVFSNEMLEKNLSNEEFVNILYRSMMGREADENGRAGWVNQLDCGYMTRSEVTKQFVELPEFTAICDSYGIIRGDYDASRAPIEHFVTRFYTLCLERKPDQAGLYGWVNNLKNQYMNGAQIADAFIFSEEFVNKNVSDEKYVELLYNTLLGRPSDANGKAGWVGELQGGHMTREGMMKAFIESTEFTGICETYGIERGTVE